MDHHTSVRGTYGREIPTSLRTNRPRSTGTSIFCDQPGLAHSNSALDVVIPLLRTDRDRFHHPHEVPIRSVRAAIWIAGRSHLSALLAQGWVNSERGAVCYFLMDLLLSLDRTNVGEQYSHLSHRIRPSNCSQPSLSPHLIATHTVAMLGIRPYENGQDPWCS